jgi:ribonuclease BN (tRNA processing enzyme)
MAERTLTFFGVRGSYPVGDPRMSATGGHTACVRLETPAQWLLLDAGTGLIPAGRAIVRSRRPPRPIHIFLTHLHIDHIMGLTFFAPFFDARQRIHIYGPRFQGISSRRTVEALFEPPFSPITLAGIKATVSFHELSPGRPRAVGLAAGVRVEYRLHGSSPLLDVLIYKVSLGRRGGTVVYATDVESPLGFDPELRRFIAGADVLIHDSQYLDREYHRRANGKKGYGHSTVSMAVANARRSQARRLFLFHHNPEYSGRILNQMLAQARKQFPSTNLARERKQIRIRS